MTPGEVGRFCYHDLIDGTIAIKPADLEDEPSNREV